MIFKAFIVQKPQQEVRVVEGQIQVLALKPETLLKEIGPIVAQSSQRALVAVGIAIAGEKDLIAKLPELDIQLQAVSADIIV